MAIYIIAFLIAEAIGWIGIHTHNYRKGSRAWVILLAGAPLFLVAALRYGVGSDYFRYIDSVAYIAQFSPQTGHLSGYEPLYRLITRPISLFGLDVQWLFVFCAAIYVYFIFTGIFRDSPYPLLSIFLLLGLTYYFGSLNLMRQNMGCAVLLCSLRYVETKEFKKFLFLVLLASGLHITCSVFIIVYFLSKIKFTPMKTLFFSICFFVGQGVVLSLAQHLFANTKYAVYFGETEFNVASLAGMAVQLAILIFAAIEYVPSARYNACFGAQLIATWITIVGNTFSLAIRFRWTFGIPALCLIPMAVKNIKNGNTRALVSIGIVVCFSAYAYIIVGALGAQEVLPYRTIFSR